MTVTSNPHPGRWTDDDLPCRWWVQTHGIDLWFAPNRGSRQMAARICIEECGHINECLTEAVRRREQWGVHGATDFTGAKRGLADE